MVQGRSTRFHPVSVLLDREPPMAGYIWNCPVSGRAVVGDFSRGDGSVQE